MTGGGRQCENRFFEAFTGDYPKPYWFLSIEPASPLLDMKGVDAVVVAKYPANGGEVRVPVQIKGSWSKVSEYYDLHPDAQRARVVVLVVRPDHPLKNIRKLLYDGVAALRAANIRFENYFNALDKRLVSNSEGKRILRALEDRSQRKARNAALAQQIAAE